MNHNISLSYGKDVAMQVQRCCKLSSYSYRARQSPQFKVLDGLQNKHKCHDAQVLMTHKDNSMYLAFRGSSSAADFKDVLNVKPLQTEYGIVHSGFFDQYLSLQKELTNNIQEQIENKTISTIYFTGHSLGGSVALISAVFLKQMLPPPVKVHCYAYGSPTTADKTFLNTAYDMCTSMYMFNMQNDIIPKIILHPTLHIASHEPYTLTLKAHQSTPVWDLWKNHSCVTYMKALRNQHLICTNASLDFGDVI